MKLKHLMVVIVAVLILSVIVDFGPYIGLNRSGVPRPFRENAREGLDIAGGLRVTFQAQTTKETPKIDETVMASVIKILQNRVDAYGVAEPVIQRKGLDQVVVELPAVKDPEKARNFIQNTALLEFIAIPGLRSERHPTNYRYDLQRDKDNQGKETNTLLDRREGDAPVDQAKFFADPSNYEVIVTGSQLKTPAIMATYASASAESVVKLAFNKEGTKAFSDYTRAHIGDILLIVLDKKIVSAPYIRVHIADGQAEISGGFANIGEATSLADQLKSGALPVPLKELEITTVDATLGRGAVDQTKFAGLIGMVLVIAFMLIFYRLPGVLASMALIFYALLTYMLFKVFGFTLSLPGIAGFIIAIGMAVDANILIFERMKEELRGGKTLHSAIDAGFSRAWPSIRDSYISTWMTCAVLFGFGSGAIKGFAVTLALGVAVSMFTAITVTRTMLHLMTNMEWTHKASYFGVTDAYVKAANTWRNIIGYKWLYLAISGIVIIPGIVVWAFFGGLNKGIDFEGGHQIEMQLTKAFTGAQVQQAAKTVGIENAKVQTSAGERVTIQYKPAKGESKIEEGVAGSVGGITGNAKANALVAEIEKSVAPAAVARELVVSFTRPVSDTTIQPVLDKFLEGAKVKMSADGKEAAVSFTGAKDKGLAMPELSGQLSEALTHDARQVAGTPTITERPAVSFTEIGPVIAKESANKALWAVFWASVLIVLYIGIMFRQAGAWDGFKYGLCAVGALLHDAAFVTGVFAILGHVLGWQVDGLFITALLTTIGFSVHDTIVVYDRIRENMKHRERGEAFEHVVNRSILQTFRRSVFTSVTVMLTLLALIMFGAGTLKEFNFALLIGIFTGTYSSIFNATPLVVIWDQYAGKRRAAEDVKLTRASKPLVQKPFVPSGGAVEEVEPVATASSSDNGNGADGDETADGDRVRPKTGSTKRPKRKKRF